MTWFKVDDTLAFHRKVVRAGNAAMGLWVRAGAHCSQQLTDGYVPTEIVAVLGTPAQAARLVKAGLWTEVDGGHQFHDWEAINPTRSDVEDRRRADAERKATARAAKNPEKIQQDNRTISPEKSAKNQKNDQKTPPDFDNDAGHEGWSQRTESDVSALPDPARPDPVSTYVDTASSSARARASKRRGITTHAELAATAVQPTARRLVDAWRNSQPEQTRHRPQVIHQLSKVADGLLRDGADPELIRAALDEWDARADVHSPNALRWLYDDAVKTARATRTGPAPATTPAILGDSPRDQRVAEWRQARELYRAAQAAAQSAGAEPPTLHAIAGGMTA